MGKGAVHVPASRSPSGDCAWLVTAEPSSVCGRLRQQLHWSCRVLKDDHHLAACLDHVVRTVVVDHHEAVRPASYVKPLDKGSELLDFVRGEHVTLAGFVALKLHHLPRQLVAPLKAEEHQGLGRWTNGGSCRRA